MFHLWRAISALLLFTLLLSGCSLVRKVFPPVKTKHFPEDKIYSNEMKEVYEEGHAWMKSGKYEEAIAAFERLNKNYPTSAYAQKADFFAGRSFELIEAYDRAIEKYRSVVSHQASDEQTRTRALYRLSFSYEVLGDHVNALASLKDALARKDFLKAEVADAEAPGRLAALYARVGNNDLASKYFKQAEKGIYRLRRQQEKTGKTPKWLAKTLFYMGNMNLREERQHDFSESLRSLKKAQTFLLQATEVGDKNWATRASDRLITLYERLWKIVLATPLNESEKDTLLARRQRQQNQWEMSHQMISSIEKLRLARAQGTRKKDEVQKVFNFVRLHESKINSFLQQPEIGRGLTEDAQERQGLKRKGRVRSAETSLERKSPPVEIKDPNL